jgi:hypothetical protein
VWYIWDGGTFTEVPAVLFVSAVPGFDSEEPVEIFWMKTGSVFFPDW